MRLVYLRGDGLLFDEILVHMLSLEPGLRVISRVYSNDTAFIDDFHIYQPDIILVNQSELFNLDELLQLLALDLINFKWRVIVIRLEDDNVNILDKLSTRGNLEKYNKITRVISTWKELVNLVRERNWPFEHVLILSDNLSHSTTWTDSESAQSPPDE